MSQFEVKNSSPIYGVVGDGRLASHFVCYLKSLDIAHIQWARSSNSSSPEKTLQNCSHIGLLINDSAIETFYLSHPFLENKTVFHCSGNLVHPKIPGAHPLMTFSQKLYRPSFYKTIPFVLESKRSKFHELLPGLNNPHHYISQEQKPLYHSFCVMAGNFSSILWTTIQKRFNDQLGLSPEILTKYLEQSTTNIKHHPSSCLTGPIVRDDLVTINDNLAALEGDALQPLYKAFVQFHKSSVQERLP